MLKYKIINFFNESWILIKYLYITLTENIINIFKMNSKGLIILICLFSWLIMFKQSKILVALSTLILLVLCWRVLATGEHKRVVYAKDRLITKQIKENLKKELNQMEENKDVGEPRKESM